MSDSRRHFLVLRAEAQSFIIEAMPGDDAFQPYAMRQQTPP